MPPPAVNESRGNWTYRLQTVGHDENMKYTSIVVLAISAGASLAGAQSSWIPFSSAKDRFSVELPGKPTATSQVSELQGSKVQVDGYVVEGLGLRAVVTSTALPKKLQDEMKGVPEAFIDEIMYMAKAKATNRTWAKIHGYDGYDIKYDVAGIKGELFVTCSKDHMYSVSVRAKNDAQLAAARDHLFNSFKIR
jgi:hypothetical protein